MGRGLFLLFLFFPFICFASSLEERLSSYVRSFYGQEEVEVKFAQNPYLDEKTEVEKILFLRVPDGKGEGIIALYLRQGKGTKKLFLPFKVLKKKRFFYLQRDLKKGEKILEGDIMAREVYLERVQKGFPESEEEILGKRLKRDMKAGSVITLEILEEPIFVERGEIVDLVFENERLFIRTKGKALERGRYGDAIRVKNLTSGREVLGRITGERQVSVN